MQQIELRPRPHTPLPPPATGQRRSSQTIIIAAVTLFALSGLLVGFAIGTLHRPQTATTGNPKTSATQPVSSQPTVPTVKSSIKPSLLGCPGISQATGTQQPDGTTVYTFAAYAMNTAHGVCNKQNNPVLASGITFKLWLVQRFPDGKGIAFPDGAKKVLNAISGPITGKTLDLDNGKVSDPDVPEISGLTFDPTTAQVQTSNAQGQVTWKYTVSPSVPEGQYDLVVLSDWAGQYFNWSWINITIKKKAGN